MWKSSAAYQYWAGKYLLHDLSRSDHIREISVIRQMPTGKQQIANWRSPAE